MLTGSVWAKVNKIDQPESMLDISAVYKAIPLKSGIALKRADFKPMTAFPASCSVAMYGKEWIFIKSSLKFDGNTFIEGVLAENLEVEIGGTLLKLPKDKVVRFHPNGNFRDGYPFNVVSQYNANFRYYVYFYNDIFCGGTLVGNATINGAEYAGALYFYSNGKVASGVLSKEYAYGRLKLPAHAKISYDVNGFVTTVLHQQAGFIGNYKFKANSYTYFHPAEKIVRFGVLDMDANIEGKIYKAGTRVHFDKLGKLIKAE
jgi:hypothetical protein